MYGGLIAVYSGLIAVCTVGLLETYVGGSDSSVHGGLQGQKWRDGEGEAGVRHRRARASRQRASKLAHATSGNSLHATLRMQGTCAVRSPQRSETEDMVDGMWPQ